MCAYMHISHPARSARIRRPADGEARVLPARSTFCIPPGSVVFCIPKSQSSRPLLSPSSQIARRRGERGGAAPPPLSASSCLPLWSVRAPMMAPLPQNPKSRVRAFEPPPVALHRVSLGLAPAVHALLHHGEDEGLRGGALRVVGDSS